MTLLSAPPSRMMTQSHDKAILTYLHPLLVYSDGTYVGLTANHFNHKLYYTHFQSHPSQQQTLAHPPIPDTIKSPSATTNDPNMTGQQMSRKFQLALDLLTLLLSVLNRG